MNKFAKRLTEILKEKNITQKEFAKQICVSFQSVSDYCTGKHEPKYDLLIKICLALNESADFLLGITDI